MNIGSIKTAVGVLGLIACAGWGEWITTPHPLPGPVHVVYWEKWTDFEGDAMRAVVDEFNRSQSKIHVDLLTISGIQDKTLLAVAGGNPPDVAGLYGPNVAQYADDKAVLILDDYCKKAGISADQYVPVYWDIGFYRNHIYSLPTTPASTALHFNKLMLREAGLPDTAPATIEDMDAIAEKIFKKSPDGSIKVSGFLPAEPGCVDRRLAWRDAR